MSVFSHQSRNREVFCLLLRNLFKLNFSKIFYLILETFEPKTICTASHHLTSPRYLIFVMLLQICDDDDFYRLHFIKLK